MQRVELTHAGHSREQHLEKNHPRDVKDILRTESRRHCDGRQEVTDPTSLGLTTDETAEGVGVGIYKARQSRMPRQPARRSKVGRFAGETGDATRGVGEEGQARLELIAGVHEVRQPAALARSVRYTGFGHGGRDRNGTRWRNRTRWNGGHGAAAGARVARITLTTAGVTSRRTR